MRQLYVALGARPRSLDWEHGRLRWLEINGPGTLPPVVLVHGYSASGPSQYGAIVRRLRHQVGRLVLPDLPGHGASSVPAVGLTAANMYQGLAHVLDRVAEPALVFASSMGGGLATRYAVEQPERVRGLMLCSPSGAPFIARERADLEATFRVTTHREALSFTDRLFMRRHPLRHLYAWGVRDQFTRPHLVALLRRASEMRSLEPEELRGLRMPVHLLWGRADTLLPPSHFEFYRAHLPAGAIIDRPDDFGHAPFLTQPDQVCERILRFARSL